MKKNKLKIFKIILDIAIFILTIILTNLDITGNLFHEIIGITIGILLIIHISLNIKYIKAMLKNFKKVNKESKIKFIITMITFILYTLTIILGILISSELFRFNLPNKFTLIIFHVIISRLTVIFMMMHTTCHFASLKSKKRKILLIISTIIIILFSILLMEQLFMSFEWAAFLSTIQR